MLCNFKIICSNIITAFSQKAVKNLKVKFLFLKIKIKMQRKRKAPDTLSDLPDYLSDLQLPDLQLPELPKENWGMNSGDIITTDNSIKVVLLIAEVVNKNFLVLEESIILPMHEEEEIQGSIDKILKEIENKERIYFCVNASCQNSRLSHQNWVCIVRDTKEIIRFEPSRDYKVYGIGEFCESFKGYTYKMDVKENGLNQIHACRLNSTILAVNHILDINIDSFLAFLKKNGIIKKKNFNIEELKKFNYKVNKDFIDFIAKYPITFERKSKRLSKNSSLFKKFVRKLKKSVGKLKKSVRKIKNKS